MNRVNISVDISKLKELYQLLLIPTPMLMGGEVIADALVSGTLGTDAGAGTGVGVGVVEEADIT